MRAHILLITCIKYRTLAVDLDRKFIRHDDFIDNLDGVRLGCMLERCTKYLY